MEIPTNHHGDIDEATEIIAAQAKEIEELQLVIVRLRDNLSMSDRDHLELIERHNNG